MNKEKYDYSKDINWDEHEHRPKVFEIKDEWEQDLVDVIFKCKDDGCNRLGLVRARLDYDEEEVQWQE